MTASWVEDPEEKGFADGKSKTCRASEWQSRWKRFLVWLQPGFASKVAKLRMADA